MAQPQGEELARVRARRAELRERYLRPLADRPASTVSGVHHLALICKDTEETIKFYQEMLGFPLVELVENRDYAGSNHFFFDIGNGNLLAFFDFPAEHWDHLRTSNPIESVFATVRHRTVRTRGSLSPTTARLMVFKLVMAAAKTWRRLKGENQLPKVVAGVRFRDGTEVTDGPSTRAA